MFLFGGGSSKKSKKEKGLDFQEDNESKSMKEKRAMRESQEMMDLRKRAKEAQKKRGDSMFIESVMVMDDSLDFRKSNTIDFDIKGKDVEQFEVFKFTITSKIQPATICQVMENRNARPSWGIDAMLIDEEMLYLDEAEADKVYQELKAKSNRRRAME